MENNPNLFPLQPQTLSPSDELNIFLNNRIPECRQMLMESSERLQQVAEYCEDNYKKAQNKHDALEETKAYTIQSLASVAYQINVLAESFINSFALQGRILSELETNLNNVGMAIDVAKEKAARREIAAHTQPRTQPVRAQNSRNGIFVIEPEGGRSHKYSRKPIDFNSLDQIGHGSGEPRPPSERQFPTGYYGGDSADSAALRMGTMRRTSHGVQSAHSGSMSSLPGSQPYPYQGANATIDPRRGPQGFAQGQGAVPPGQMGAGGAPQIGLGPNEQGDISVIDRYATLGRSRQSAKTSVPANVYSTHQAGTGGPGSATPGFPYTQQQQMYPPTMGSQGAPQMGGHRVSNSGQPNLMPQQQQQQHPGIVEDCEPIPQGQVAASGAQMLNLQMPASSSAAQMFGGRGITKSSGAGEDRPASPPLPPPPPEMTSAYDEFGTPAGGSANPTPSPGLPPPPPPDYVLPPQPQLAMGMHAPSSSGGVLPPAAMAMLGPAARQSLMHPMQMQQPNYMQMQMHMQMQAQGPGQMVTQSGPGHGAGIRASPRSVGAPDMPDLVQQSPQTPGQQSGSAAPPSLPPGLRLRSEFDPEWAPEAYIEKVVAVYDYSAVNSDELNLLEGQVLFIIKKNEDDWWEAVVNSPSNLPQRGLIPSNYVQTERT